MGLMSRMKGFRLQLFQLYPSASLRMKLELFQFHFFLALGRLDEREVAFGGRKSLVAGDFGN